jgi:hypothetical protein
VSHNSGTQAYGQGSERAIEHARQNLRFSAFQCRSRLGRGAGLSRPRRGHGTDGYSRNNVGSLRASSSFGISIAIAGGVRSVSALVARFAVTTTS